MRRVVLAALLTPLFATPVSLAAVRADSGSAQAGSTRVVSGRVLDATRAPIAGARVTAVPDNQSAGPSTVTDERGEVTLPIDPGRYTITVAANGFLEASQILRASQTSAALREFVLQVAGVHEDLTVTAPAGYRVPVITSATKT